MSKTKCKNETLWWKQLFHSQLELEYVSQNIPTSAQFHIVQLYIFKVSGSNFQVFSEICPGQDLVGEKR